GATATKAWAPTARIDAPKIVRRRARARMSALEEAFVAYVTFAKQGPGKADDAARPGNGFVDVFAPNGDLLQRLVSRGKLDSPWAVTLAPATFGAFGGD